MVQRHDQKKFESSGKYVIKYCLDGEIERNVKRKSIWYIERSKKKRKMKLATRLVTLSSVDITVASAIFQEKSKKFFRGAINLMWYTTMGIKNKLWNDGFFESPELNDVHILL